MVIVERHSKSHLPDLQNSKYIRCNSKVPHLQNLQVRPGQGPDREAHQVEAGQGEGGQGVLLPLRQWQCPQRR